MLPEIGECEGDLESHDAFNRQPQKEDDQEPKGKGEEQLAGMKSESRRDCIVRIGMMRLMESPQEGHCVVRSVPDIGSQIQRKDRGGNCDQSWEIDLLQQPEPCLVGPVGDGVGTSATRYADQSDIDQPNFDIRTCVV